MPRNGPYLAQDARKRLGWHWECSERLALILPPEWKGQRSS